MKRDKKWDVNFSHICSKFSNSNCMYKNISKNNLRDVSIDQYHLRWTLVKILVSCNNSFLLELLSTNLFITSASAQLTLRLTHSHNVARTTARHRRLNQSDCQKNETLTTSLYHYTATCQAFNIRFHFIPVMIKNRNDMRQRKFGGVLVTIHNK